MSVSLTRVDDWLAACGEPGDAEQALKHYALSLETREQLLKNTRAVQIDEGLLERNLSSAWAARDLSVGVNKLGNLLLQRGWPGDLAQALKYHKRSLEMIRLLAPLTLTKPWARSRFGSKLSDCATLGRSEADSWSTLRPAPPWRSLRKKPGGRGRGHRPL
jgi:hypothetical protein